MGEGWTGLDNPSPSLATDSPGVAIKSPGLGKRWRGLGNQSPGPGKGFLGLGRRFLKENEFRRLFGQRCASVLGNRPGERGVSGSDRLAKKTWPAQRSQFGPRSPGHDSDNRGIERSDRLATPFAPHPPGHAGGAERLRGWWYGRWSRERRRSRIGPGPEKAKPARELELAYKSLLQVAVSETVKYWANLQKRCSAHSEFEIQLSLLRRQFAQERRFFGWGVQERVGRNNTTASANRAMHQVNRRLFRNIWVSPNWFFS